MGLIASIFCKKEKEAAEILEKFDEIHLRHAVIPKGLSDDIKRWKKR